MCQGGDLDIFRPLAPLPGKPQSYNALLAPRRSRPDPVHEPRGGDANHHPGGAEADARAQPHKPGVFLLGVRGPSARPGDASVRSFLSGCVLARSFVRLAMASPSSAPRLGWSVTVTSRGFDSI